MAKCPTCKNEVPSDGEFRPFCTARCKDIDLSRWLSEEYTLSRPMNMEEVEESFRTIPAQEGEHGPN